MAKFANKLISEWRNNNPLLSISGVVSLNSYLTVTKPSVLNKIKGVKAIVEDKGLEVGKNYLYIKLPLFDNKHEELRIWDGADLDEGDEVWISSIIVLLLIDNSGNIVIRYDARLVEEKEMSLQCNLRSYLIDKYTDLISDRVIKGPSINNVYDGGKCPPKNYKTIVSNNYVFLKIHDSYSWRLIRLDNYKSAKPLTNGLILCERYFNKKKNDNQYGMFDILNADGSIFCSSVKKVYYGQDYLNCDNRLWLFSYDNHIWEELKFMNFTIIQGTVGENMIGVYKIMDLHNGMRVYKKNAKKYFFIDFNGEIKIEIEDEWVINSGFHNGQAVISKTNHSLGDYFEKTIDREGNVVGEIKKTIFVFLEDDPRDEMRDLERDNWDAMTDGMYGDYPENGYDGDYDF